MYTIVISSGNVKSFFYSMTNKFKYTFGLKTFGLHYEGGPKMARSNKENTKHVRNVQSVA